MHSTLTPKPSDDPHDVVAVAPDAVRVAPSDEELSDLLQQAARYRLDSQTRAAPEAPAAPAVPPVDTTFRPAAVNDDVRAPGRGRSIGRGALRAFTALLLAASIGVAAFVWRTWGDTAEKKVARWATQFVMTTALPPEDSGRAAPPDSPAAQADAANAAPSPPASPAVQADAANAASPPPQLPAQNAPAAAAPSPDPAQLLQSMARDLASLGQEVELLKASIAELRTSQQQLSRDAAKAAETKAADIKAAETKVSETKASEARASEARASRQSQRSRTAAAPPRPATARARKPTPPSPPMQAAAPPLPLAGAPYYAPLQQEYAPRQFEPPPRGRDELTDSEYETVPRPPMPLR